MINEKSIYVYYLANKNGRPVRIGSTNNLNRRGEEHKKDGLIFEFIVPLFGPYATQQEAEAQEGRAFINHYIIYSEIPIYNTPEEAQERTSQFFGSLVEN